jgi:hypothetical protein
VPLALALVLAARAAAAQSSPPPSSQAQKPTDPLDDATIRWGMLGLNPALLLRDVGRDNNVFNEPTAPKSDFTFTFTPKLDVLFNPGPMRTTFTTSTDYVYYETYSSERGTNLNSSIRVEFDLGAFKPFVNSGHSNTRDRLNREIDTRARRQESNYGGGLRVQLFEGVFATASGRYNQSTFDPNATFRGENLATTMNQTTEAVDAGGGVALTPLTTFQVTVTREQTRFDFSPERNSETWRVMPAVSFSPMAILHGTASVGYRKFTGHSPGVPDYSGLIASVTLGTTIAERHRLEATFARDLQYGYDTTASEYIETGLLVNWAWRISGPLDLRVNAARSRLHYRTPSLSASNDNDTANNYGASLGYHIRQNLRLGINADWTGRASQRSADYAYDNRRIYASVTWGKE